MTQIEEIEQPPQQSGLGQSRLGRGRSPLLALLAALALAAAAVVAFSTGGVSAQTQNDNGDADQQQDDGASDDGASDDGASDDDVRDDSATDDSATDDSATDDSDSEGTCDKDGAHRIAKRGWHGQSDAVAEVLGIDAETLWEQLKAGMSLADIAAAQGVEASAVVDAIVDAISERAAEFDREIDIDALTEKVTARVNGERPEGKFGKFAKQGEHGRRGFHRWGGHFGSYDKNGTQDEGMDESENNPASSGPASQAVIAIA